jgi:two-component SAPR family response regulator
MTTILLVDDSKFTCNRTIEMLREIDPDVNVIPVYLPSKALELVQSQGSTYDLAIIDFNMPEMNGLELAEKIRSIIPYDRIVILTASSAFTTHSQTIPEGMHFCQKPVNEEKLRTVLQFQRRISA